MKLTGKNIALIAATIFIIACLYSIIVEELIPYWNSGQKVKFWATAIGAPISVFGALVFCYGGFVYVKSILFWFLSDETVIKNVVILRSKGSHSKSDARIQNFKLLLHYSRIGCLWLVLGFAIIILGAFIVNYK